MQVIKTENLTKYYVKARGIIGLELEVKQGECFGFIGPNGATVVSDLKLDAAKIAIGMAICMAGIAAAYLQYTRKDIR